MTDIIKKHPELKLSYGGLRKVVAKIDGRSKPKSNIRKKKVRTAEKIEEAAKIMEENPYNSIMGLAKDLGVSKKVSRKMLHVDLEKKCFKCVQSQELSGKQMATRLEICKEWAAALASGSLILEDIWFSDEKFFRLSGGTKAPQNHRVWVSKSATKKNMSGLKVVKPQKKKTKGVMISLATNMNACTLPCFVKPGIKINTAYYLSMLEDHFVPEITYRHTTPRPWVWQQDNAPSHVSKEALQWINRHIGTVAGGRRIRFPPNSPDLNPLDFSVWTRLEDEVTKEKCETLLDVRVALKKYCDSLMSDTDYLKEIANHWVKRVEKCIEQEGGHFEHMLD